MATPAQVLADAGQWVDAKVPYLWGGVTRFGADCSGFVQQVFAEVGVSIGRTTGDQVKQGTAVALGPAGDLLANAQPGDVIFYGMGNADPAMQHEGIYVGNGQIVNEPHTGAVASYASAYGDSAEPLSAIRRFTTGPNDVLPGPANTGGIGNNLGPFPTPSDIVGGIAASGASVASGVVNPLLKLLESVAVRAALVIFGLAAIIIGIARLTADTQTGQRAEHAAKRGAEAGAAAG